MEPLTSHVPMMVIEGNHEIEPQAGNATFASYKARFAVPAQESNSSTSLYYSFDAGGIHFIMLGGYIDYNRTGTILDLFMPSRFNSCIPLSHPRFLGETCICFKHPIFYAY